mgnify:CR=1 FL=1
MSTKSFYPNLGTIVTLNDFPEELQFIQDGLQNILDKIYYRNLQYVKSPDGAQGYFDIELITNEQLKLNLFDSGLSLVVNPSGTGETTIPLTLNYNWPVLAFIKSFNLQDFSFLPEEMQDILNQTLSLGDNDLIRTAMDIFETGQASANVQSLVDKVNAHYNLTGSDQISYPADSDPLQMAEDVRWEIIENALIGDSIRDLINNVYISSADVNEYNENLDQFTQNVSGESIGNYIRKIITPQIEASLELAIGLAFPRKVLTPLTALGGDPLPAPTQSMLTFDIGTLDFSTVNGIAFQEDGSASLNHPSQIGNTGLGIDLTNIKLDLSSKSNIAEANLDGRPSDFMGLFAEYAAVSLPSKWFSNVDDTTLVVAAYNMLIGTGGVSGTIALEATDGTPNNGVDYLDLNIGNWVLGFNYFDLTFAQNAIVESNIAGLLTIPKFKNADGLDAKIGINGHLNEEGDFNLIASEKSGIPLNLFNFVTINFLTLEVGSEDGDFYLGTSCEVWFENDVMNKILNGQKIVLPNLRVYDDGSIEIVGGNAFIPTNISLNLGPIEVAVTGIHFGSHQQEYNGEMRKYNYWGFDGAISLDPLGIDARGEGIKYYYTTDNDEFGNTGDSFLRIQTIEVDLVIPGTAKPDAAIAIIHGMLSIPEPGESPEYRGAISVKLPKAKIAGGAAMRLQPKHPAFLLDAYVDLPAPIPIGPVGIYGFRGLLGFRYVAEKEAVGLVSGEDTWYDYFVYPPKGIDESKFSGPERTEAYDFPFSIGAGAVLGTGFDDGTTLSVRAMMLLSLPTLFLVEGKASILSVRLGLEDNREPPFFAFVAWGDNSIEMGMGADFQLPQSSGFIMDLYAEVQAGFFFNNPGAWYVNFGTKDKPITARVLTIVTAQSYLMLSGRGIEAGARVEFDLRRRFGPARVHINAYLEMGGRISFERPQIGGYLALGGMIDVDIWIVGITLGLDALFSVEAANPFLIYAELRLKVCVKIVFARVCKRFTVRLKWEKSKQINDAPIPPLPYQNTSSSRDKSEELVQAVHMMTNEAFAIDFLGVNRSGPPTVGSINSIIPLDSFIDIKSAKALNPGMISDIIGGHTGGADNFIDLIPPEKVVRGGREVRQVKHKYSIEAIELKAWAGSWVDYHPFEALTRQQERDQVSHLRIGYWQRTGNQYDSIRLLATNPFSYTEAGEPGWVIPEQYGITPSELFCESTARDYDCANVLNKPVGKVYYPPTQYIGHFINGAYFTLENLQEPTISVDDDAQTVSQQDSFVITDGPNNFSAEFDRSLAFQNNNSLAIILQEPSVGVRLKLTTKGQGVVIRYYTSDGLENYNPVYRQILVEPKTAAQLRQAVSYTNETDLIAKIVIEPQLSAAVRFSSPSVSSTAARDASATLDINAPIADTATNSSETVICQIYNEIDDDGIDEYRFRLYDAKGDIILSSSTRYTEKQAAIDEFYVAVNNLLNNPESIDRKRSRDDRWYFNVIDPTGEVIARRIEFFEQQQEVDREIDNLMDVLKNHQVLIDDEEGEEPGAPPVPLSQRVLISEEECDFCKLHQQLESLLDNAFNPSTENLQAVNYDIAAFEKFADLVVTCGDDINCGIGYGYGYGYGYGRTTSSPLDDDDMARFMIGTI